MNDGIKRLRAEAAALAARCEELGREAGRAWALAAAAGELKRLAVAAGRFGTIEGYVNKCAAGGGLATQLFIDVTGSVSGEFVDAMNVDSFWADALDSDADAIHDPDVATAFVIAALAVWAEATAE